MTALPQPAKATFNQKVWVRRESEQSTESPAKYELGPGFDSDKDIRTRTFLRSQSGGRSRSGRKQRSRLHPTTSVNTWDRYDSLLESGRLGPITNGIAAFTQMKDPTKLWVTTYPYSQTNKTRIFGPQESLIFHVHVPIKGVTEKRTQFAAAPATDDFDADESTPSANVFVNNGPIMRPLNDVLYLDTTFWRQYIERLDQNVDIFVPGVFPKDLAQIEKVAVDIAVLRNKEEFETVAKALGRNLPNVRIVWAVVTNITGRPAGVPDFQIAHIDDGLPHVTDEQKVELGIHGDAFYAPKQGIVTANLKRLKLLGALEHVFQFKYMKLTYFADRKASHANIKFDLNSIGKTNQINVDPITKTDQGTETEGDIMKIKELEERLRAMKAKRDQEAQQAAQEISTVKAERDQMALGIFGRRDSR